MKGEQACLAIITVSTVKSIKRNSMIAVRIQISVMTTRKSLLGHQHLEREMRWIKRFLPILL